MLLVIAGIVWALVPSLPSLEIQPHVVLAIFLTTPAICRGLAFLVVDFRRWLRPILSLAIGLVGFTILCVGVVAKKLMRSAVGGVLLIGAILSPTDTVAVGTVLSRLRIPRR